jgi:hypothetical protein
MKSASCIAFVCLSLISWFPTFFVSTRAGYVNFILSANFSSLFRFDTAGVISDFLCSQVWQSLRQGEYQNQG